MRLATRAASVPASRTSGARRRAQELAAAGTPVVNLAAGELPGPPPAVVLAELERAAATPGAHLYAPTPGLPALREALAGRIGARLGVGLSPDQFLVTCGAKHALSLAVTTLFDEGDEVLVPVPAWGTFLRQVELVGARPVTVDTSRDRYQVEPARLEDAVTPATRGLILNTPHNPTGAVYDRRALAAITDWAAARDLWVLLDESYADLVLPPAEHVHPWSLRPGHDHVVTVGSFSKSFAVTGWRVGYLYGPRPVIAAAGALQSHLTSHAPGLLQRALVPAAAGLADGDVAATVTRLSRRVETAQACLARVPGVSWQRPDGAFYLFLDCGDLLGRDYDGTRVDTVDDLAEALLTRAGVAVTSGTAFGAPRHVRVSLTADDDELIEAFGRLEAFVRHAC